MAGGGGNPLDPFSSAQAADFNPFGGYGGYDPSMFDPTSFMGGYGNPIDQSQQVLSPASQTDPTTGIAASPGAGEQSGTPTTPLAQEVGQALGPLTTQQQRAQITPPAPPGQPPAAPAWIQPTDQTANQRVADEFSQLPQGQPAAQPAQGQQGGSWFDRIGQNFKPAPGETDAGPLGNAVRNAARGMMSGPGNIAQEAGQGPPQAGANLPPAGAQSIPQELGVGANLPALPPGQGDAWPAPTVPGQGNQQIAGTPLGNELGVNAPAPTLPPGQGQAWPAPSGTPEPPATPEQGDGGTQGGGPGGTGGDGGGGYGGGGYGGRQVNPIQMLMDFLFGGPQALLRDLGSLAGQAPQGYGYGDGLRGNAQTDPQQFGALAPGWAQDPSGQYYRTDQGPAARRPETDQGTAAPQGQPAAPTSRRVDPSQDPYRDKPLAPGYSYDPKTGDYTRTATDTEKPQSPAAPGEKTPATAPAGTQTPREGQPGPVREAFPGDPLAARAPPEAPAGGQTAAGAQTAALEQPATAGGGNYAAPVPWRQIALAPHGQQSANFGQPFNPNLRNDRAPVVRQIEANRALKDRIYRIAYNEQGSNPQGTQAVMESLLNRTTAFRRPIASEARWTSERGYYANGQGVRGYPRSAQATLDRSWRNVVNGSNISNYATDNSSEGRTHYATRQIRSGQFKQQSLYNGEYMQSPGNAEPGRVPAWHNWVNRMQSGGGTQTATPAAPAAPAPREATRSMLSPGVAAVPAGLYGQGHELPAF